MVKQGDGSGGVQDTYVQNTYVHNSYAHNVSPLWLLFSMIAPLTVICKFYEHCTMQPSIAIGSWIFFESNCLVCAYFWSKWDKIFFDWCKTVNILQEKYFPHKYNKKCHFSNKKMWRAGLWKLKFFTKIKEASRKKTS